MDLYIHLNISSDRHYYITFPKKSKRILVFIWLYFEENANLFWFFACILCKIWYNTETVFIFMFKKLSKLFQKQEVFENSKEGAKDVLNYIIAEIEWEKEKYQGDEAIWSIFIAWAPWSGKTEFVETVLDFKKYIVIDIDKYRKYFKGYNWKNAKDYQDSCSRIATGVFKYCLKNNLRFIFDGTLSSEMGKRNIKDVIKKWRTPSVILVYQWPQLSFLYTKLRQQNNERNVDIKSFMRIYYQSIYYCFLVYKELIRDNKKCNFIVASKSKNRKFKVSNFISKKEFDKYFKIEYSEDTLKKELLSIHHLLKNEQ